MGTTTTKIKESLLTRDEFREAVFKRDNYRCVNCHAEAQDAHHILERRLFLESFEKGGYFLSNGASVCGDCHILAEQTLLSPETLREKAGIKEVILPDRFYSDLIYDKWGNPVNEDGSRSIGELFYDESVQKIMREGGVLHLFDRRVKYPRTMHLPWSNPSKDDKVISSLDGLLGRPIVVTLKLDGENQSLYHDRFHARSLDSDSHPSQTYVRNLWGRIMGDIPESWRFIGENLYAYHSIRYRNLASYFYLFSIWNEHNHCLSWNETEEYAALFDLVTVPVLFKGVANSLNELKTLLEEAFKPFRENHEGYVVRTAEQFAYGDFRTSVAKFVRKNHVAPNRIFWRNGWYPSEENCNSLGSPAENGDPS